MLTGCEKERRNLVHIAKVNPQNGAHQLRSYEENYSSSTEFGLLANLFCSEGKRGKVVEVQVKYRTGDHWLLIFVMCLLNSYRFLRNTV